MFNKNIDYEALWDEIENELDTDVTIEEYQNINDLSSSHYQARHCRPIYDPLFFIFFPHRRHY
ncbi:hypothetical protein [Shimazuella kribbensis]|uniref:hypothetical protein n=1 Tax=Shimazuella kribbensis TaxID=139808 RepID=UPI0004295C99|nr:hypothetical protein [Shimazuella kribbensis]